jgi:DNA-binding response OmpR family regulator
MNKSLDYLKNLTLLYVEDDIALQKEALVIFRELFSSVISANDGIEAFEKFLNNKVDLIITDAKMPKLSGLDFIKEVRLKDKKIPIILTTAYEEKELLKSAIKLNINYFLEKPYNFTQLENAFKEALKFSIDSSEIISFDSFSFDMQNMTLTKDNKTISLMPQERVVLKELLKNKNQLVSYERLKAIASKNEISNDALKVIISSLRKKIGKEKIANISKFGYMICV